MRGCSGLNYISAGDSYVCFFFNSHSTLGGGTVVLKGTAVSSCFPKAQALNIVEILA